MANELSDASSDDPWMIPPEEPAPHPGCPVLGRPVRMSALPPKADIRADRPRCPLCANSGHRAFTAPHGPRGIDHCTSNFSHCFSRTRLARVSSIYGLMSFVIARTTWSYSSAQPSALSLGRYPFSIRSANNFSSAP